MEGANEINERVAHSMKRESKSSRRCKMLARYFRCLQKEKVENFGNRVDSAEENCELGDRCRHEEAEKRLVAFCDARERF